MHVHRDSPLRSRYPFRMVPDRQVRERLGLTLRNARERAGLTKDDVAAQLTKPVLWGSELEAGSVAVFNDELVAIAYGTDQPTLLQEFTRTLAIRPPT